MEKGQGNGTDTLPTDNVFTRKDYIDREKVVELLNKWADGYSYIEVPTKDAIACVRAIPAADVVPVRHGRWIDMGDFISCSLCNATQMKEFLSDYGVARRLDVRTNYCPNCGARMDGDKG